MRRAYLLPLLIFIAEGSFAQNVGIGTTTPTGPLSFPNVLGNKIVLYGDGNLAHYGFGIQGAQLQMYSDAPAANISFGYGRSGAFTERMRLINGSSEGLLLYGRVTLKNGTSPLDQNYGAGIWMFRADNTAALSFVGVQNNQNIGFYGGPAGWGFTYDAINSRVGIGNNNPNAPLAFPPSLGKKITLYPGATGDVGFGVAGNRLQIYSDNPNADVAIGYDAAGTFNERFAVKPNGALAINGSTGSVGQVLKSNGNGSAASWVGRPYVFSYSQTADSPTMPYGGDLFIAVPGLNNQSFTINETSNVVFHASIMAHYYSDIVTGYVYTEVQFLNSSLQVVGSSRSYGAVGAHRKININVVGIATLPPGFYTTRVVLGRDSTDDSSPLMAAEGNGKLIIEVFPN